jgi:hypothetical protein
MTSHTSITRVPCLINCQNEDSIESTDGIMILGLGRYDDSSDDDSSDDEITSDGKGYFELNTFPLYSIQRHLF